MKNNIKVICGCIAGFVLGSATIVCANQAIQAMQNTEIKVSLNGQVQEFKDETTGERQYPITYNNRTYLPLRNVASLSGLSVDYDNSSNTATLTSNDSAINNIISKIETEFDPMNSIPVYFNNYEEMLDPIRITVQDINIYDKKYMEAYVNNYETNNPDIAFSEEAYEFFKEVLKNNQTGDSIIYGDYRIALEYPKDVTSGEFIHPYIIKDDKYVWKGHFFKYENGVITTTTPEEETRLLKSNNH